MKPLLPHWKWSTFEIRMEEYRRNAFCRTFGHAKPVQRGLRNPMFLCGRCNHEVEP